jgi:hypothetical protein
VLDDHLYECVFTNVRRGSDTNSSGAGSGNGSSAGTGSGFGVLGKGAGFARLRGAKRCVWKAGRKRKAFKIRLIGQLIVSARVKVNGKRYKQLKNAEGAIN